MNLPLAALCPCLGMDKMLTAAAQHAVMLATLLEKYDDINNYSSWCVLLLAGVDIVLHFCIHLLPKQLAVYSNVSALAAYGCTCFMCPLQTTL